MKICAEALGAEDARASEKSLCEETLRAEDVEGAEAREGEGAGAAGLGKLSCAAAAGD